MASVKVVLRKEVKADGTSPLAIRITKDRKTSYIYLEYSIREEDWDKENLRVKKSHPNSKWLNNFLLDRLAKANNSSLEMETVKEHVTARAVSNKIKPKNGITVFKQADLYLERLKATGKFRRWSADTSNIKHLKEFLKTDVSFAEITIPMIERYKDFLLAKKTMGLRTAINHIVTLRSIFSQAIKDEVCDPKYYPFGKGKYLIKFPDTTKQGLSADEIKALEKLELPAGRDHHARNLFLLSFYFAGMRVSDVLRLNWLDIQDGRLNYTMGKNNKGASLKISDKALAILKEYEADRDDSQLVFKELRSFDLDDAFERDKRIATCTNMLDQSLRLRVAPKAKIKKKLTMHIARHSFGNLSGDKIPIQMLQKLYRHSHVTTTINYQSNFIHKETDDALEAVINF